MSLYRGRVDLLRQARPFARTWARERSGNALVGGAYPGIPALYALPAGMYYNPETDLIEGTVYDTDSALFLNSAPYNGSFAGPAVLDVVL